MALRSAFLFVLLAVWTSYIACDISSVDLSSKRVLAFDTIHRRTRNLFSTGLNVRPAFVPIRKTNFQQKYTKAATNTFCQWETDAAKCVLAPAATAEHFLQASDPFSFIVGEIVVRRRRPCPLPTAFEGLLCCHR